MASDVTETRTCAVGDMVSGTRAGVGEETIGQWEQLASGNNWPVGIGQLASGNNWQSGYSM